LKEINPMTVTTSIDPALPWAEQVDQAEPDLLRVLLKTFVQALMSAEADATCYLHPPPCSERSRPERSGRLRGRRPNAGIGAA
jgi:putative transposase